MSQNNVIEIQNLTRKFGHTEAVKQLNLQVPKGSIFAFLGANGSGKTTTIKMMMNILFPTSGRAELMGVNSRKLGPKEFQKIGYVSENQRLPEWMTVVEFIDYCRAFYPTWDSAFSERLFKQFDLPKDRKLKNLSRGMKAKAALLSSLAYRPELLVLDEPFSGLDALVRDELIRGILELCDREGWTIFITSHDIEEVERLADWVSIIDNGQLQFSEPVEQLQARFRRVEVVSKTPFKKLTSLPKSWLQIEVAGCTLGFVDSLYREEETLHQIKKLFSEEISITETPLSLREIFLTLAKTYRIK